MAGSATPAPIVRHRKRGIVRLSATLLTDAAGATTAAPLGVAYGLIRGFLYDGGLDASATITISDAKTGAALVTYVTGTEGTPVAFQPTQVVTDNAGAAVSAAGTAVNVNRPIAVAGRINVAVASGGNLETCKIALIVDEAFLGKPLTTAA